VSSGYHVSNLSLVEGKPLVAFSATSHMPSIVASGVYLTSGRWQYEVTVTRAGRACIGWANSEFFGNWESFVGVGGTASSVGFGYDGRAAVVAHDGKVAAFGKKWAYGDVVTVGVDVDAGVMTVALNGSSAEPLGSVPLRVALSTGSWLVPALSYYSDFTGVLNFGASALAHPLPGFTPIAGFRP
jgi:hypothetical protein